MTACDGGSPAPSQCTPGSLPVLYEKVFAPSADPYPPCSPASVALDCSADPTGHTATAIGSVVDCAGNPIANARVSTGGKEGTSSFCVAATHTDDSGHFRLDVPYGRQFDYGFADFGIAVHTANGVVVAYVDNAYACPTSTCTIVVP